MVCKPTRQTYVLLTLLWLLATSCAVRAQDAEPETFRQGTRYIEVNLHSLDKYNQRASHVQHRLLNKLARKERRYASRLQKQDSAAYANYKASQTISYDSIRSLLHPDSATLARFSGTHQTVVDSLKGVYVFLQSQQAGGTANLSGYYSQLNNVQAKLNYQQFLDGLISSRTNVLQNIGGNSESSILAVGGIQKEVYYAKSRIAAWKELADNPSKAEEKALEYLQGQEGFDTKLDGALRVDNPLLSANSNNTSSNGTGSALSVSDLERMGYQTKRSTMAALQKQFGNNLNALQGQLGKQVNAFQDKAKDISGGIKDAKAGLSNVKGVQKPAFKINSMRGLPFWQRIEKGYSFNIQKARDANPSILKLAATAGFRYSPTLSIGLGIASDIGLGKSFSAIRFSFQGAGFRSYLAWQLTWGIGVYAGYERMYRKAFFTAEKNEASILLPSTHNTIDYNESVLLGLTKTYHINSKYNGAVQVLYDFWWKEKNLTSPIILRFTTQTK